MDYTKINNALEIIKEQRNIILCELLREFPIGCSITYINEDNIQTKAIVINHRVTDDNIPKLDIRTIESKKVKLIPITKIINKTITESVISKQEQLTNFGKEFNIKDISLEDEKDDSTHIRHEFAFVLNPKNAIKYKDKFKPFVFTVELGSVGMIEKESDESYMSIGSRGKITNCYSFQAICKHQLIRETDGNVRYHFSKYGQHKENTITFFKNGKYLTTISPFNYGEYDNLLIL